MNGEDQRIRSGLFCGRNRDGCAKRLTEVDEAAVRRQSTANRRNGRECVADEPVFVRRARIPAVAAIFRKHHAVSRLSECSADRNPPRAVAGVPGKHHHGGPVGARVVHASPDCEVDPVRRWNLPLLPRIGWRSWITAREVDETLLQHPDTSDDQHSHDQTNDDDGDRDPHSFTVQNARDLGP